MSVVYSVAPDVAWVEAADGGKDEPAVWISHLPSATQYQLTDTAWLMWVLIAEAPRTAAELLASMKGEAGGDRLAVTEAEIEAFLTGLSRQHLLSPAHLDR